MRSRRAYTRGSAFEGWHVHELRILRELLRSLLG